MITVLTDDSRRSATSGYRCVTPLRCLVFAGNLNFQNIFCRQGLVGTGFAFEDDASFFEGFQGMPLTYRDAHAYLGGIGRKLKGGCLLACIVIIVLYYFSAKDDNRFGRASVAMDGEDSARFYGIEDALVLVFRSRPKIKGLTQSWVCFRLN